MEFRRFSLLYPYSVIQDLNYIIKPLSKIPPPPNFFRRVFLKKFVLYTSYITLLIVTYNFMLLTGQKTAAIFLFLQL